MSFNNIFHASGDTPEEREKDLLDYLSYFPGYPGYNERKKAEGLLFYHGSNAEFDFPDFSVIDAIDDSKPLKVLLGLYVTPMKDFASKCGEHLYEIVLRSRTKKADLTLNDMVKQYNTLEQLERADGIKAYKDIRAKYRSDGVHLVNIIEHTGWSGESVIVNLDAIKIFKKVSK